jgi:hypothetical protein
MMAHQRKNMIIAIFVLVTLAACAAKPPPVIKDPLDPQKQSYSEIWLDKRILQVDFKGGIDENVDKMKNVAVLRAAEIGKERKFERFVILNTADQVIIDGVRRSGNQYTPIEILKVSISVKFIHKDDSEYPQAFDIDAKIGEIQNDLR